MLMEKEKNSLREISLLEFKDIFLPLDECIAQLLLEKVRVNMNNEKEMKNVSLQDESLNAGQNFFMGHFDGIYLQQSSPF